MNNATRSALWNILFGVFFVGLVLLSAEWLFKAGRLPSYLTLGDFFLIALATFRLTRLVCYDIIFAFLRDFLTTYEKGSFFGTLGALVHCPWCAGLWFAAAVTFFYFLTPIAWFFVLVLAIAGIASVLQITANLIGWSAESRKRAVLAMESKSSSTCG
jgi:hypothetical protein